MKGIASLIVVVALAGCAMTPPDWIERTLVTEDVTGAWYGRYLPSAPFAASAGGSEVWLDLRQEGSKVRGSATWQESLYGSGKLRSSGPVEGTIGGDVLRFRQTDGPLKGELTVSGGEMTGVCSLAIGMVPIVLRRVGSSSHPDGQSR
jgi:hypothetical protein